MLNYQIEVLDRKLPYFLENFTLDTTFIAHVKAEQLLNEESIQEIETQRTDRRRILKFIEFLKKQAPKKFNTFLTILQQTDQLHVYKEINNARHQKIKHLPKSPEVDKNTREKLHDFTSFRLLSTSESEYLVKNFVRKSDYEEINEDKHILRGETDKLKTELSDAKEAAEYEMKHHQLVKEEYYKIKEDLHKVKHGYNKQLQKITDLKYQLRDWESKEKDYKSKIKDLANQIELLNDELNEVKNSNILEPREKLTKRNSSVQLSVSSQKEEETLNTDVVKYVQEQIENLRNIAHTYTNENDDEAKSFEIRTELDNLKNTVTEVLNEICPPENESITVIKVVEPEVFVDRPCVTDTDNESGDDKTDKNPASHKHVPHKPKHAKHPTHHKERKRVIILETELSEMRNRMKKLEDEKWEQNALLQQKEKQQHEEQKQITSLRMMVRSLKNSNRPNSARSDTNRNLTSPWVVKSEHTRSYDEPDSKITPSADQERKLLYKRQQFDDPLSIPAPQYTVQTLNYSPKNQNQLQLRARDSRERKVSSAGSDNGGLKLGNLPFQEKSPRPKRPNNQILLNSKMI